MDYLKSLLYYRWGKLGKEQKEPPAAAAPKARPNGRVAGKKSTSKDSAGKQQKQEEPPPTPSPVSNAAEPTQQPKGGSEDKGKKGGKDADRKGKEEQAAKEEEQEAQKGDSKGKGRHALVLKALNFLFNIHKVVHQISVSYVLLRFLVVSLWPPNNQQDVITFQDFRTEWLEERRVSQLHVVNEKWAKVFELVWPANYLPEGAEGPSPKPTDTYMCKFLLGSLDVFEEKIEQAQRELGYSPDEFVPVRFVYEGSEFGNLLNNLIIGLMAMFFIYSIMRLARLLSTYVLGRDPYAEQGSGKSRSSLMGGGGGLFGSLGGMLGMASPHQIDKTNQSRTLFKDVAGCDEAKGEIMEFVDYLKSPKKYQHLGAQIPKGALLVGPPGTGKTLLARAAAGEASVPFLGMNGSEFCEMFAGVGSSKVRDLFNQARSLAPCMVFIDEIDAIGRARGRRAIGADADRESTLNQLLVEMDGFASSDNVVVIGSTNRADILDKALLRPGRFSRQINVDAPDVKGREQIFRVYLSKLKLAKDMDYFTGRLAALTPGMTGADISNVCNEAALCAGRLGMGHIDLPQFESAIDRVIGGLEKKHKVISKEERRVVATHESGHAVVSWFLEFAEPLLKVSIVPRGSSTLGFAQYLPNENLLMNKEQLLDNMRGALGGRAAEQVILGKISTGAVNDLEKVTQMAYAQVAVYGMNDKVGLLSYRLDQEAFDKPYSNETAHMVDTEARLLVSTAYASTLAIVEEKREFINAMADLLLEKEVIGLDDIEGLLGPRPFASTGELRNIDRYRKHNNGDHDGPKKGGHSNKRKKGARKPVGS